MLCLLYSDFCAYSLFDCVPVSLSLGDMCLSGIVTFPSHLHLFQLKGRSLKWVNLCCVNAKTPSLIYASIEE